MDTYHRKSSKMKGRQVKEGKEQNIYEKVTGSQAN